MQIHDNPNTVLTNYPPFDWMVINLQNYIHLSAFNAAPQKIQGKIFEQTGQGSGMLGLPGDLTPPSRFVRISTFLQFANQPQNRVEAVNLAEHLLNTFDIPKGVIRDREKNEDYTQWIVIKDQTNKVFYFRSYKNLILKSIDMKKIHFEPGSTGGSIKIDLSSEPLDVTSLLN
jgi:choloylglycine hydrolase